MLSRLPSHAGHSVSRLRLNSDNVLDEISFALRNQKTIIPVLYLDCDIPLRLERHQHIDFRTDHAHGLKALLRALGMQPPTRPVPQAPPAKQSTQRAKSPRLKEDRAISNRAAREEPGTVSQFSDEPFILWKLSALRTLEGHSSRVNSVAVTPDGKRAVSAAYDKTLKVWDLESGRALRTLKGHSSRVNGVAVTPDGKRAVSASDDYTLKVWDLESGRALRTLKGHSSPVYGVAVTPDGKQAVSASSDKTLKVWELESGRALRTLEGHSLYVYGVAVTPDGKRAVSASDDNSLKVWELETGRVLRTLEGHSMWVTSVAVTPDGQCAISASSDHTLKVWDLATGHELRTLKGHSSGVNCVAVTADGKRNNAAIDLQDMSSEMTASEQRYSSLVARQAAAYAAAGVDITGGSPLLMMAAAAGRGERQAAERAVSASSDETVKVWHLASGRELATFKADAPLYCCAVSPDGKTILAGDEQRRHPLPAP